MLSMAAGVKIVTSSQWSRVWDSIFSLILQNFAVVVNVVFCYLFIMFCSLQDVFLYGSLMHFLQSHHFNMFLVYQK